MSGAHCQISEGRLTIFLQNDSFSKSMSEVIVLVCCGCYGQKCFNVSVLICKVNVRGVGVSLLGVLGGDCFNVMI